MPIESLPDSHPEMAEGDSPRGAVLISISVGWALFIGASLAGSLAPTTQSIL